MIPFSHTPPREAQSLTHRTMTGSSRGGRHASLAPMRYKALQRAIADIVAAIPTLHVREQLPGAKNWLACCAAVCKLQNRPGPAERRGYGGVHPSAAHCEPEVLATAARWGQRHLLFERARTTSSYFARERAPVTRTAELRLDDAFSVGKTKNTSCFGKSPDPPWLALTVAGAHLAP